MTDDGITFYRSPTLESAGVPHAFSTRAGGISDGTFASLNLGNPTGAEVQDDPDRIAENYRRLQRAIGCEERSRAFAHQVHGSDALIASRDEHFENGACGDAIISDDSTRLLAVRTADCVPILLSTRDGRRVAAIHAGWRGVIAGVIDNALKHFSSPQNLLAAIGPCISFDAFEVGDDVLRAFENHFGSRAPIHRGDCGKGHVDLHESVRLQLILAGLNIESIDTTDRCTHRDADEFFSHRRERGVTGRMAAIIGAVENSPT